MRSIRKFAYAAALTFSIFAVQPTLAKAEDARGVFRLSHDVHWQDRFLRAGDYTFTLKTIGQPFLLLRGVNGTGTDAVVLVRDFGTPKLDEGSRLVLVSRNGESFVSSMELPNYDMTLDFNIPSQSPLK
jgi:hypothetical protein